MKQERRAILLDFEKPIQELKDKIAQLEQLSKEQDIDMSKDIAQMHIRTKELEDKIYDNLTPLNIVHIARHQYRPTTLDYIRLIFNDFIELKGDRYFADDPAIVGGFAELDGQTVMIIGHQKGQDTKENIYRNFGMPQPEGYRKALRLMQLAEKFNTPILTLVDTPGAFPGLGGEERGQAEAIARNLREMSTLKVPVLAIITGEGGSGGALGIAVANKVMIMQYGVYSVISPEACGSILWRDAGKAELAAKAMKMTAPDLVELGVVDGIILEPRGGAHNDYPATTTAVKQAMLAFLKEYSKKTVAEITDDRYQKFRRLGFFNA